MFHHDIYVARREKLKNAVGNGLILLLGNEDVGMNYADNCYPYRQDSTFLYFFGIDKPKIASIINIDKNEEIVFGDDATIDDIIWMGTQPTLKALAAMAGVNKTNVYKQLEVYINAATYAGQAIHFLPPYRSEAYLTLHSLLYFPINVLKEKASVVLIKAIIAQRSIKSAEEVAEIEKAINISNGMQLEAMRLTAAGVSEAYIAGKLHGMAISEGGSIGYPIILTTAGQTLHNHPTQKKLQNGDLVLCDCGAATSMHYTGDLTRTFPVDNIFSSAQKEIYEIVLSAEIAAANALEPAIPFRAVHNLACEKLVEGLQQLGLMKGDKKEAVAEGAHALFFPCGLGHMMGLDVHDMENLGEQYVGYTDEMKKSTLFGLKSLRLGKALEPGFVLTVEPGIYFIPALIDLWQSQKKFESFINYGKLKAFKGFGGARVEENFLITSNGHQLLGNPLIKTIKEIEAFKA